MDLVRGNAVKLLTILLLTALSLSVFAASHQVDWPRGIAPVHEGRFLVPGQRKRSKATPNPSPQ
jgi:ABC-type Fe2+-enterobactin transport system substrate-binding protein